MTQDALEDVVRQQAEARVRGDDAWFAAWMTPQALLQLRDAPRGARSMRIASASADGDAGVSHVRYTGMCETYVIEQRWLLADGAWRCVAASVRERKLTIIGRIASLFGRAPEAARAT